MVFNGILYHSGNSIIFQLTYDSGASIYSNIGLILDRVSRFQLTPSQLWLPGSGDNHIPLPRSESLNLRGVNIKIWIEKYREMFLDINKCEPTIIDLNTYLETEIAPEMGLP